MILLLPAMSVCSFCRNTFLFFVSQDFFFANLFSIASGLRKYQKLGRFSSVKFSLFLQIAFFVAFSHSNMNGIFKADKLSESVAEAFEIVSGLHDKLRGRNWILNPLLSKGLQTKALHWERWNHI